jgi:signal transduction histidine kinase
LLASVILAFFVLTYRAPGGGPRPDYVIPLGLALAALVAITAGLQLLGATRYFNDTTAPYLDTLITLGFLFLYSWESESFIFMIAYLVAIEAGILLPAGSALSLILFLIVGYLLQEIFSATVMNLRDSEPIVVILRVVSLGAVGAAFSSMTLARRTQVAYDKERVLTKELQEANEMKTAFLRAVSHELRTPLTAISGFAHLLADRGIDMSPEQQISVFKAMGNSADKLEEMFGELLDLDRLSRGVVQPQLESVDVLELTKRVVADVDPAKHPVTVMGKSLPVEIDVGKVERIVHNLVVNAVKHTPPNTPIEVRVETNGKGVVIVVEDTGDGIPDGMKEEIFEPFKQGSPSAPGAGIGLSLVIRFAELHGGRAWVEDAPGGGACFKVLLPALP